MSINISALKDQLCHQLCNSIDIRERHGQMVVSLPMVGRDGDVLTGYIAPDAGGWRISDMGSTLMRLSYEHDINRLLSGPRGKIFMSVLAENGLLEDDGELYCQTSSAQMADKLFSYGMGLTRIADLSLWTRTRTESTFYDDLKTKLHNIVDARKITANFLPSVPNARDYPVDYKVDTGSARPLYVFGVSGRDKARLTTIVLQHLTNNGDNFDSLVICSDTNDIPSKDFNRLMAAANDILPDLSDTAALKLKIQHRMAN